MPNEVFVLQANESPSDPVPRETYSASTSVRQVVKDGTYTILSGSRTIIYDVLLWSNSCSMLLLLFECVLQVMVKYRVSLKI